MPVKTTHFRVGNGDMMLVEFDSGRKLLVDINIRAAADDPDDETPDVASQLRDRLVRDSKERLYVDAFLLTHPDADHCRGLAKHFHLGPLSEWSKSADKIVIREMWSSPIIFRRATRDRKLCDDASAWASEARRRVKRYRDIGTAVSNGDYILIMGEDEDGKTDDLKDIVVKVDTAFHRICGFDDDSFKARLLAPLIADDVDEEETLSKNNSSVVLQLKLHVGTEVGARYLIGGDAEVAIWDRIWDRNKSRTDRLEYDVLIAPHHCSWHSLSYDSWSEMGEDAKVSGPATNALGQALEGARIISSSSEIIDDDNDPPSIRAQREYKDTLDDVDGTFHCLADGQSSDPLVLTIKVQKKATAAESLLRSPAAAAGSFTFPNRQVKPSKPDGFS